MTPNDQQVYEKVLNVTRHQGTCNHNQDEALHLLE